MRLRRLEVGSFKNLQSFRVDFDAKSHYTVLVGGNGAGKSNLMEAIALIFRHLDLDAPPPFDYEIAYECRGTELEIRAKGGRWTVSARPPGDAGVPRRMAKKTFLAEDDDERPLYRPAFVFGYYSGQSDRLSGVFEAHRRRYYDWIIRGEDRRERVVKDPNSLRRLFYAETLHGQFALIAFFMESDEQALEDQAFLREHLQIESLDSVLFALKRPPWGDKQRGGDPRFWGAQGEVQMFLDLLYAEALAPSRMSRRMASGVAGDRDVENLYLFLPNRDALQRVYGSHDDQYRFFTALESTDLSQMLAEVRTRVRVRQGDGENQPHLTYRDLSEGEQQLLLVLGLLKFTARDEALFLLDEPDTHLNPAWSTQYLGFLDHFIRGRASQASCHIMMATHDPLVFSRLEREQVRIVTRGADGRAAAEAPDDSPVGMGIQAILASDLFGLTSGGLDEETLEDLDLQRKLSQTDSPTEPERQKLDEVTERLKARGFWKTDRDPLFQLFQQHFVPRWIARSDASVESAVSLTPEQVRRRQAIADEIAAEIAAEFAAEQRSEGASR